MEREPFISVIIPVHNNATTIGTCLEAVFNSRYEHFEVIVVDDCSEDGSTEIIKHFPARLVRLSTHSGASKARNTGVEHSQGEALFFIDADCVVFPDTLDIVARAYRKQNDAVLGGTYSPLSHDRDFFSDFQSVFIHYSETKKTEPDYIATHAMVIGREHFLNHGGFQQDFMPILEDVEFSHRLRRAGVRLLMYPEIRVRHIFRFTLFGSLKNAFRKSMYWTMYSIVNQDLLKDSGTASVELKTDTLSWGLCVSFILLYAFSGSISLIAAMMVVCALNLIVNRRFMKALFKAGGSVFGIEAVLYYTALYPLPVAAGGLAGVLKSKFNNPWKMQCTRP